MSEENRVPDGPLGDPSIEGLTKIITVTMLAREGQSRHEVVFDNLAKLGSRESYLAMVELAAGMLELATQTAAAALGIPREMARMLVANDLAPMLKAADGIDISTFGEDLTQPHNMDGSPKTPAAPKASKERLGRMGLDPDSGN